jgi:hypothetical protein
MKMANDILPGEDKHRAKERGEALKLNEEERAFYDALENNDSAIQVLGDETLRTIAREVADALRKNVTIDWTLRENVRAQLRVIIKRILRKYGYPTGQARKGDADGAGTSGVVGLGSSGCLIFLPRSANEVPPCGLDQ